jgi:hypothetical protein
LLLRSAEGKPSFASISHGLAFPAPLVVGRARQEGFVGSV